MDSFLLSLTGHDSIAFVAISSAQCCSDDLRRDPQSVEEAINILNEIERLAEDCLANGVKVSNRWF